METKQEMIINPQYIIMKYEHANTQYIIIKERKMKTANRKELIRLYALVLRNIENSKNKKSKK